MNISVNVNVESAYRYERRKFGATIKKHKKDNVNTWVNYSIFLVNTFVETSYYASAFLNACYSTTISFILLLLITSKILCSSLFRIHSAQRKTISKTCLLFIIWEGVNIAFFMTLIIQTFLITAGIESNQDPNKATNVSKLSFAHWNVDGLLARDGIKM